MRRHRLSPAAADELRATPIHPVLQDSGNARQAALSSAANLDGVLVNAVDSDRAQGRKLAPVGPGTPAAPGIVARMPAPRCAIPPSCPGGRPPAGPGSAAWARRRGRWLRAGAPAALLAAWLVAGLVACATPSVPVPPPRAEKITFEFDADEGQARFAYGPSPDFGGAVVYVYNRSRGVGVITTAESDGSVAPTAPFAAGAGDDVLVTFDLDHQLASICVEVADGLSSAARECAP
jgi:hypothetical protein